MRPLRPPPLWAVVLLLAWLFAAPLGAAETIVLATGERPPYLGAALPDGGYVAELVQEAFKRKGYQVRLEYYTWARARLQAAQGDAAGMIATGSESASLSETDFFFSDHFPGGVTGLLKKRSLAASYGLADGHAPASVFKSLSAQRFAAVRGGVSLQAFDDATYLHKEWVANDLMSLDMLAQGQVQFALIDKYTAADLMVSQRPRLIGQLEFMAPALEQSDFHIAFSRRMRNHVQLAGIFNAGLAQLRQDGTLEKIMSRHGLFPPRKARSDKVSLTIATVNNHDMIIMQEMAREFEKQYPNIKLDWRVLDETTLRRRLLGDLAVADGQFDVMTIGTYELPIWARRGWLEPLRKLPASYGADDLLPTVRQHLSYDGQLYALPFYAESVMTYYRKDLFSKAGLAMPAHPSYADIAAFAAKIHNPAAGVYGICLRGNPGWGANMAFISTLLHAEGGRWFDPAWRPELSSPAWNTAVSLYADLLGKYGPPNPERNGFNENLALFSGGHCGIWIDATVAAGMLFDAKHSKVSAQLGYAPAPTAATASGGGWLWSWALAIPVSSTHKNEAEQFIAWATSKEYIQRVADSRGWVAVPPGTRKSTYANPSYLNVAPFARFVQNAIESADTQDTQAAPKPYIGIQYVSIPEFETIGDRLGLEISKVLRKEQSVDKALKRSQNFAIEQMQNAEPPR